MIETIEKTIGKKADKNKYPMQTGDVFKTVSDITKAQKILNYFPQTDFENGIKKYIKWRNNQ